MGLAVLRSAETYASLRFSNPGFEVPDTGH